MTQVIFKLSVKCQSSRVIQSIENRIEQVIHNSIKHFTFKLLMLASWLLFGCSERDFNTYKYFIKSTLTTLPASYITSQLVATGLGESKHYVTAKHST